MESIIKKLTEAKEKLDGMLYAANHDKGFPEASDIVDMRECISLLQKLEIEMIDYQNA